MRKPENKHWLILIALIITAFYAYQTFYGNIINSTQSALFSTLVPTLCTIFALIFTISLVAAQIGSKYSQETMDLIFNRYAFLYMFSYLVTILFCMFGLQNIGNGTNITRIGSILAVMNFSLLIPFIYVVKEKLKTKNLLKILSQHVIKAKKKNKSFEKYTNAIDNIIYSSYKELDFVAFEEGIRGLLSIYVEVPDPRDLADTIMKTIKYVDSLSFQEERSTDIIMDALCDAALECIDNGEKVERIVIELGNFLKQIDDIRLKIKYLPKVWGRTAEIFDNCIKRDAPLEMVYQVYYRTFSMIGFYLLTLHRMVRDVPELKGKKPEKLAALPDFARIEIMKVVEPGFESTLNDLISVIGDWVKEAEKEELSELRNYYVDLLTEIKEKSDEKSLTFESKKLSDVCDEVLREKDEE